MRDINEVTEYIRTHGQNPRKLQLFLTAALSKLYINEEITTIIFGHQESSPYKYSIYFLTDRNRLIVTTEECLNEDKIFFKPYSHIAQSYDLSTVNLSDISYGKFKKFLDSYVQITLRGIHNTIYSFEVSITVDSYKGDETFNAIKEHFNKFGK